MLQTSKAVAVGALTPFTFTVPAQYTWKLLTVVAVCSTHAGGAPNRAYRLTITDGTNAILSTPAADAGTEPATVTVTWANAQPSAITAGNVGVSLGPLAEKLLLPGYVITGTILNGVASDQWTSAVAWYDEAST